jgi:hypothetical protein
MPRNKPDTILISYQRSGLNWVRYCTEYFSGFKTYGRITAVDSSRYKDRSRILFYRTHNVLINGRKSSFTCKFYDENRGPLHKRVILLLRNYKENFGRIVFSNLDRNMSTCVKHYMANLEAYDKFEGEKLLIYYEDLVRDFGQMERILNFLNIEYDLRDFDIEKHTLISLKAYHRRNTRKTLMDLMKRFPVVERISDLLFYSRNISVEDRLKMDDLMMKSDKQNVIKYLLRYREENLNYEGGYYGSCKTNEANK